MFNFASKVFNAIGDLVSDVDQPKPAQPQPLQPSPQRRSSADARFFQTKYSPRFPTPSQTQDDHLPRLGSSSGGSGHVRPSSTPVYRYPTPTPTTHTTPSYRPERYEESKFKAPDIDYNEDGYNVGRNYNGSERQSSYITELQKEYGMYREHDVDDANDYEEEDRYSVGYENEGNRRRRSLSSERETSQLKSTGEEYNENVIYNDPTDRNHYARESHQSKNEPSTSIYDTHQLFSSDAYDVSDSHNTNDFAQFSSGPSTSSSSWIAEEVDDYNKSRRRRKSNPESDKQFRIDHDDKISPSPPSQDEDARNSSRSESESSDEISFGEALATGLIPPNITPEMAARMNIELINQPKGVIESFYGHSPGEVYTIPEEEDEICSPTGADGVTSLRKQRMASARVESTSTDQKELQNQRGRISSTNPQSDLRLKQKYSGQSLDSKSEFERQLISDDMKENRPMVSGFIQQDANSPFNPLQKYLPDDHRPAAKQPFRYVQSTTQPSDNAQYNYGSEKPTPQQTMPPQQPKPNKNDGRPTPYQHEIRPQMYQPEVRPQMYQPDGRPQVYQYDRTPQTYPNEIRPAGQSSSDRSQIPFQDRSQLYTGDRLPQTYQPADNRTQYSAQVGQTDRPQNYPQESIQPYQPDNRSQQQQQQQQQQLQQQLPQQLQQQPQQPYQTDNTSQGFQPMQQNNRAQGYQADNRSQNYQSGPPQAYQQPSQNFQKDVRAQGYHQQQQQQQQQQPPPPHLPQQQQQQQQPPSSQTDRQQNYPISDRPTPTHSYPQVAAENQPQGYQQGYQSQNYPPDNRPPQGYQPSGQPYQQNHPQDNRAPGYQQGPQGHPPMYQPGPQNQPAGYQQAPVQGHPPDGRPIVYPQGQGQGHQVDNRSQGYPQPAQGYPPDNRPYPDRGQQSYPADNRPIQGFQPDNRSQPYQADPRAQPYQQDNRQKPQETRRLPQPQPYDDQSQRPPNQNYPQGSPYRDSDNRYTQFQRQSNDLQDDRRLPPQGVSQQDYQDQYRQLDPRDDPQDRQFPDQGQGNRRRLPLRKYNSEERYGSFQQDYDPRNSQSHESPGRMQHEEEYDAQDRPIRRFPEKLKHRSSSLEHERDDQHYVRSRSSSFERSQYADEVEYEQYSGRDQRRASLEHKKMLPRLAQEYTSSRQSASGKQIQSRVPSRSTSGNSDKTRIQKQGSWQDSSPQEHSRSRTQQDSRKEENFCLQHKKFTGSPSSGSKPGARRVLPKEPPGQAQRKTIKRSQSQDKSTTTVKSEDGSHQRAGILSNAARKTERSGPLKITFSDPISNLLHPKKNTAASVAARSRTETSSKNTSTKSDKPVITSNILPQSKNYIYPLPVTKTPNQPEPPSRSPVPPAPSPLYRNQPQFDQPFRDSRLALSPNTRSLPIPIAQRTCSLDRYSSSETNLNASPYYHDQFSRPGSAPGLMYEPVHQLSGNQPNPLSMYELHALKKEEKFWSDIYSALPSDMKHLITNRNMGPMSRKLSSSNASFSSVVSSPATVIGGSHPAERASLENRMMQRSMMAKGQVKGPNQGRDNFQSSLGERIGNRLRMLHEMKEQAAANLNNRRKMADSLSRRSASDGEYSFSSTTNFPLCWNLSRRPHSDSAIDLIDRLEVQNAPTRVSGSAYNSSEYLTKVVDKSQSYLASPCTNVPPSPAPTQPVRMLRDTALRGDHTESLQVSQYHLPLGDQRSGFFSCLQNIESLTRQYEEEDRMRTELDYDDEIYSEPGIPDSEYGRYHRGLNHPRRRDQPF